MNFDWQAAFYIVGTFFLTALLVLVIYIVVIIRTVMQKIEQGKRAVGLVGSVAKMSFLRTLLKIFK